MKVNATQQINVELSKETLKQILFNILFKTFDWHVGDKIIDGWIHRRVHYVGGSHAFSEVEKIRPATNRDLVFDAFMKELLSKEIRF